MRSQFWKNFLFGLFFCWLFQLAPLVYGQAFPFFPGEYESLRALSAQVAKLCPPIDCTVVGIGRSPSPIIAFLQNIRADYAINLPLSWKGSVWTNQDHPITPAEKSQLFQHYEEFLPKQVGKRIMLLDFTISGEGIALSEKTIRSFLKERRPGTPLEVTAISLTGESQTGKGWHILSLDRSLEMREAFVRNRYKNVSAFGKWFIGDLSPHPEIPRAEYLAFQHSLERKMREDPQVAHLMPKKRGSCEAYYRRLH